MKKLDKKKKTKWIKALLSGKYVQGRGGLVTEVSVYNSKMEEIDTKKEYCCLGVACQIRIARKNDSAFCTEHFLDLDTQKLLANMNDGSHHSIGGKSKSFKQIAKWIDKNL